MSVSKKLVVGCLVLGICGQPLMAKTLRDIETVDTALFQLSLAYSIQKHCPSIKPRLLRALGFRNRIMSDARSHGFTDRQIEDHVDSKVEQARMQEMVDEHMLASGQVVGSSDGYCAIGATEMAQNTAAGRLLR
ncbi:MAG: DUF5333 domain-containing protein [Paracoccaceae bacterium]|nr:DUF5333 domain-containing protein [Paracoccaceae bacterium]